MGKTRFTGLTGLVMVWVKQIKLIRDKAKFFFFSFFSFLSFCFSFFLFFLPTSFGPLEDLDMPSSWVGEAVSAQDSLVLGGIHPRSRAWWRQCDLWWLCHIFTVFLLGAHLGSRWPRSASKPQFLLLENSNRAGRTEYLLRGEWATL